MFELPSPSQSGARQQIYMVKTNLLDSPACKLVVIRMVKQETSILQLVIFKDTPLNNSINAKVLSRGLHWYMRSYCDGGIFKYNQSTLIPCFTFISKTCLGLTKRGVKFYSAADHGTSATVSSPMLMPCTFSASPVSQVRYATVGRSDSKATLYKHLSNDFGRDFNKVQKN